MLIHNHLQKKKQMSQNQNKFNFKQFKSILESRIVAEGEGIVTPRRKAVGEPEPGSYAYERKYGKFTAKGELRKKPNPNKPPVKEETELDEAKGPAPGYMLKADPALAKKVKEKQDLHKVRAKAMGNPAAGKSVREDYEPIEEQVKTTHEDPLVTVHDKDGLHTHANLSTANRIFNTNVKHTDVHKGPVTVTSGREDKNKLKFAISKHHEAELKEQNTPVKDKLPKKPAGEYERKVVKYLTKKYKTTNESVEEETEDTHYCAKHVRSALLGDGVVLEAQHADPDADGNIEWYLVEFKSGIHKVYTEDLEIMIAEYHGNHKKKRMTNGQ